MAVSGTEILKDISAWGVRTINEKLETLLPQDHRLSVTYTLRGNFQAPQLRIHGHESLCRSPSFFTSSGEWPQSHR